MEFHRRIVPGWLFVHAPLFLAVAMLALGCSGAEAFRSGLFVDGSAQADGSGGASGTGGSAGPCAGVAAWSTANISHYVPGTKVVGGKPTHLYRCKAYPAGSWCLQTAYQPADPSDFWRDAWDDLGPCN